MSTESMLAKCGLTAAQVSKMVKPRWLVAAENEDRYENVTDLEERFVERISVRGFDSIASSNENGDCGSRRSTYKYWKRKEQNKRFQNFRIEIRK